MLFNSNNVDLLPPKPKLSFRYLKQGIQEFHRKYILDLADKAANNVVVVWRLYYINTLIQELGSTKTYERISTDKRSIVNTHSIDITAMFAVSIKEKQDRFPTLYWLPKLHKRPYKARFIANSSSCTTTVLSKLLTSCLTAVKKKHWIRYYDTIYEMDGINYFGQLKIPMMFSINLNRTTFRFCCMSFHVSFCSCVFFSLFSIAITSLGEERANLSAFRTFVQFVLVWIRRFSLPLGVWEGLRFVIVALPGLFSYLFFFFFLNCLHMIFLHCILRYLVI